MRFPKTVAKIQWILQDFCIWPHDFPNRIYKSVHCLRRDH